MIMMRKKKNDHLARSNTSRCTTEWMMVRSMRGATVFNDYKKQYKQAERIFMLVKDA